MQELRHDPIDICLVCPGAMSSNFCKSAGIPRMLTNPDDPAMIAEYSLRNFKGGKVLIPRMIDKVYNAFDHLMPRVCLDWGVSFLQSKLLDARRKSLTSSQFEIQ